MGPNEEQVLFYYEIGMAISQWAHVEMALRDVVINCASGSGRRALSIGFYSIENFRSKLQFCDNLLAESFDTSPELTSWHGLRDRLTKASTKRNRLAHRSTITYLTGKPG